MASVVHIICEAVDFKNYNNTPLGTCHTQVCDIIGHLEAICHGLEILLQINMS